MNAFSYKNPTEIRFGRGVMNHLGSDIKAMRARNVLLVYGGGSIKTNGIYDAVLSQLSMAGVRVTEWGGVQGNPILSHARAGIERVRHEKVDLVLAVGGGSVLDEAKAIALGASSELDVWDFFERKAVAKKCLPMLAISTLPATGSEMNGIAVLTNKETDVKSALVCPGVLNPIISYLDPETTFSLSMKQTAYACTDILSHVMEGYLTTSANELLFNDPVMEGVMKSTLDAMARIQINPMDYEARAAFMWSATMAWNGICQVGLPRWGMPNHALEMPMSAVYDIAHGAGLSIVFPAWIRAAGDRHKTRILQFGRKVLGVNANHLDGVADALAAYYTSIGSPVTFAEAGVESPDLERMTQLAYTAFKQRGLIDYSPELIRRIYGRMVA